MGKIKEFAEMDGYTETQLLMCEKEDLIEYIEYLRKMDALEELQNRIVKQIPHLDIKEYSHNIITMLLETIHNEHGEETVKKTILELGLKERGW